MRSLRNIMLSRHIKTSSLLIECITIQSRHVQALQVHCSFNDEIAQLVPPYESPCVHFHSSHFPGVGNVKLDSPKQDLPLFDLGSSHPDEILHKLNAHRDSIKGCDLLTALSSLSDSYKNYSPNDPLKILHFRKFSTILKQNTGKLSIVQSRSMLLLLRQLKMSECLEAFPPLIKHMLHHIEDMTFQDFIEIASVIQEQGLTNLPKDLQKRIPDVFAKETVVKLAMGYNESDVEYITQALHFMSKFMSYSEYHGVIDILMKKLCSYPEVIPVDSVLSILESLSSLNHTSSTWQHLLLRSQDDLSKHVHLLTGDQIKRLVGALDSKTLTGDSAIKRLKIPNNYGLQDLYNEKLILSLIDKVVSDDMGFEVAQRLSTWLIHVGYKDEIFLDYYSITLFKIIGPTESLSQIRGNRFLALMEALGTARYKSVAWDDLTDYYTTEYLQFMKFDHHQLICLASRLMSLNWYPTRLLKRVFDGYFECPDSSAVSRSFCGIYQKLKSCASYKGPLPTESQIASMMTFSNNSLKSKEVDKTLLKHLKEGIKNPLSIRTVVRTRLFHEIDHVVGLSEDGTSVPITNDAPSTEGSGGFDYLEDLRVPAGCHLILILEHPQYRFFENTNELFGEYQMAAETLQTLYKYPVVVLNKGIWDNSPDDEKTSFLMNEIQSKLKFANYRSPPIQRIQMERHIDYDLYLDKLIHILTNHRDSVNNEDEVTDHPKIVSYPKYQKHLIPSEQTTMRAVGTSKGQDNLTRSTINSSFVDCSDLSIRDIVKLSDKIRNMKLDEAVKERVLHTFAQNILNELLVGSRGKDIRYLSIALQFVAEYLKQCKYYELIKILLAKLHGYRDLVPLNTAISILKSLKNLEYTPPKFKLLVQRIENDVGKQADSLLTVRVDMLADDLRRAVNSGLEDFYNEEFIDRVFIQPICSDRMNLRTALKVLDNLSKMGHKSHELLEYCTAAFVNKFVRNCNSTPCKAGDPRGDPFPLIFRLSMARHRTAFLEELREYAERLMHQQFFKRKALINLTSRFVCLDCYPIDMLKRALHSKFAPLEDEHTRKRLCRIHQKLQSVPSYTGPMLSKSQISKLLISLQEDDQAVRSRAPTLPILKYLQEEVDIPLSVKINVKTRLFHNIDYVVAFHENGIPAPLDFGASSKNLPEGFVYLDDFKAPPNTRIVLILAKESHFFFRNTKELIGDQLVSLESLETVYKYPVVVINLGEWNDLPDDEKTPFLMGAINAKVKPRHGIRKENERATNHHHAS